MLFLEEKKREKEAEKKFEQLVIENCPYLIKLLVYRYKKYKDPM